MNKLRLLPIISMILLTFCFMKAKAQEDLVKAEYPGGQSAMMQFLSDNIKYPADAQESKTEGRVFVQFVIDTDGSVVETKVIKSVCPSLDKEALRVIKSMPKWNPATKDGENVRMKYTLPVIFKLNNDVKKVKAEQAQ